MVEDKEDYKLEDETTSDYSSTIQTENHTDIPSTPGKAKFNFFETISITIQRVKANPIFYILGGIITIIISQVTSVFAQSVSQITSILCSILAIDEIIALGISFVIAIPLYILSWMIGLGILYNYIQSALLECNGIKANIEDLFKNAFSKWKRPIKSCFFGYLFFFAIFLILGGIIAIPSFSYIKSSDIEKNIIDMIKKVNPDIQTKETEKKTIDEESIKQFIINSQSDDQENQNLLDNKDIENDLNKESDIHIKQKETTEQAVITINNEKSSDQYITSTDTPNESDKDNLSNKNVFIYVFFFFMILLMIFFIVYIFAYIYYLALIYYSTKEDLRTWTIIKSAFFCPLCYPSLFWRIPILGILGTSGFLICCVGLYISIPLAIVAIMLTFRQMEGLPLETQE